MGEPQLQSEPQVRRPADRLRRIVATKRAPAQGVLSLFARLFAVMLILLGVIVLSQTQRQGDASAHCRGGDATFGCS